MMEVISSRKNPLVAHIKKLAADKGYRRQCGEFLCEGQKLLDEAVRSGAGIVTVIFCGSEPSLPEGVRTVRAPENVIASLSELKSPPEVLFVCRIPDLCAPIAPGKHIVLENMQDPGNIGTILRTANAFDVDTVILAGACADPYGPKAVRASMGAVFRQRILEFELEDLIDSLGRLGIPLYAAALTEEALDLRTAALPKSLAVAVGNEGRGLSRALLEASAHKLIIPMKRGSESLNAAAAATVLMWELFRQ